jgi:hypothetical protein
MLPHATQVADPPDVGVVQDATTSEQVELVVTKRRKRVLQKEDPILPNRNSDCVRCRRDRLEHPPQTARERQDAGAASPERPRGARSFTADGLDRIWLTSTSEPTGEGGRGPHLCGPDVCSREDRRLRPRRPDDLSPGRRTHHHRGRQRVSASSPWSQSAGHGSTPGWLRPQCWPPSPPPRPAGAQPRGSTDLTASQPAERGDLDAPQADPPER